MTNRMRTARRRALRLAVMLSVLAMAQAASAIEGAPQDAASKTDKPDDPPPLGLDQKPKATAPVVKSAADLEADAYSNGARTKWMRLFETDKILSRLLFVPRKGGINLSFALWIMPSGHIGQIRLTGSLGNPADDAAFRDELQAELVLPPPTKNIPMPILGRFKTGPAPAFGP